MFSFRPLTWLYAREVGTLEEEGEVEVGEAPEEEDLMTWSAALVEDLTTNTWSPTPTQKINW